MGGGVSRIGRETFLSGGAKKMGTKKSCHRNSGGKHSGNRGQEERRVLGDGAHKFEWRKRWVRWERH